MANTVTKEIKQTKKLAEIFRRYGVIVREGEQEITHATTGKETTVSPIIFAVFETAIKANHLSFSKATGDYEEQIHFVATIAEHHGFAPVDANVTGSKASEDYRYCVRLLADAGHWRLLD